MEKVKFRKAIAFTAALLLAATSTTSTFPFRNNEVSVTASADFDEDASITPSDNYLNAMLGSNDSILTVDETKFPTGATLYGIFTTERADSTGDIGIYPGYTDFNMTEINKRSDWAASKVISASFPRVTNQQYKLEYGAVPYCFLREKTILGDTIYRFDVENQTIDTSKHWENNSMISITLDEETFPMMKGCNGVEIYGKELDDGSNDDVENEGETKIKLKYSADELFSKSGSKTFSYRINWNTPSRMCRVRFLFDDGYVEYSVITEDVYLNRNTRNVPALSPDSIETDVESDFPVRIYEGANVIETMSGKVFKEKEHLMLYYNPDKTYYLFVGLDKFGTYGIYYKYDKELKKWVERINTKEKTVYQLPINMNTFPNELAEGDISLRNKTAKHWTQGEFCMSTSVDITTKDTSAYEINFYKDGASSKYKLVGIDPELVEGTPTAEGEMSSIPFEISPLTSGTLHGETEAGDVVEFEFESPDKNTDDETESNDFFLFLPDGNYHVESENGLYDDFTVDKDGSQGKEDSIGDGGILPDGKKNVPNLKIPEDVSSYKVTDENGNLVDEGQLSDGVFDSLDDLNLSEEELREKGTYFYYETEVGVKNSTDPYALQKESGCFTVTEDGTLYKEELSSNLKGDVNMDGEVTVADVIMVQKYLLKTESFTLGNYVNADTFIEGDVNAFDLAILKRIIINN